MTGTPNGLTHGSGGNHASVMSWRPVLRSTRVPPPGGVLTPLHLPSSLTHLELSHPHATCPDQIGALNGVRALKVNVEVIA